MTNYLDKNVYSYKYKFKKNLFIQETYTEKISIIKSLNKMVIKYDLSAL